MQADNNPLITGNGFTLIVKVDVVAHCPAVGVKIYVVVFVLSKAGDQVPVMPLLDAVGRADKTPPVQIATTGVKVGVINGFTTILNVDGIAQPELTGVKL